MILRRTAARTILTCALAALSCLVAACPAAADTFAAPATVTQKDAKTVSAECVVETGPALPISALAFSPDGNRLAVGGYKEVLLWDLPSARLLKRIGQGKLSGMVRAVLFADQGKKLAVGDGIEAQSGNVTLFEIASGEKTQTFDGPQRVVECLAIHPDGKLLVAGSNDSNVYAWNLDDGELVRKIDDHGSWVLGVSFSGNGKRMATCGADRSMRIWSLPEWKLELRYDLADTVQDVVLNDDGSLVVGAVGGDNEWMLRVGRIDSDIKIAARRTPRPQAIGTGVMPLDLAWPPKSQSAFVALSDGTLRSYRASNRRPEAYFGKHDDWAYCVAVADDGSKVASAGADGTVRIWSPKGGKPLATLVHALPGSDDWAVLTAQGFYSASKPGIVKWRRAGDDGGLNPMPERLLKPELIGRVLAAGDLAAARPPK